MAVWFDPPARHGARIRGRSVVSVHLMADSTAELLAFGERLGLRPAWIQHRGTYREHFDVMGKAMIKAARAYGAEQLTRRAFVERYQARRATAHDGR